MQTRKILTIRLNRNKRARKAQRLQNIECCLTLILMFTVLGIWGMMTSTILN